MTINFSEYVNENTIDLSNVDCSQENLGTNNNSLASFLKQNAHITQITLSGCNLKISGGENFNKGYHGMYQINKILYFNEGAKLNLSNNPGLNFYLFAKILGPWENLHKLTAINISGCNIKNHDFSGFLSKIKSLKSEGHIIKLNEINISHNNLNDDVIDKLIASFKETDLDLTLRKINISFNTFSYNGLKKLLTELKSIPNKVEAINFEGNNNLSDVEYHELQNLLPINSNSIDLNKVISEDYENEIKIIDQHESKVGNYLQSTEFIEKDIQKIREWTLHDWQTKGINNFSNSPSSMVKYIKSDTLDCTGVKNLLAMNLNELLNYMHATHDIKNVKLSDCNITIEYLNTLINGNALMSVIAFPGLESIDLSSNYLSKINEYFKHVEYSPTMRSINLSYCFITYPSFILDLLSKFPNLEYLNISHNILDNQFISYYLCEAIKKGLLNNCKELDIQDMNLINFTSLEKLIHTIKDSNCGIKVLKFSSELLEASQIEELNKLFNPVEVVEVDINESHINESISDINNQDNNGPNSNLPEATEVQITRIIYLANGISKLNLYIIDRMLKKYNFTPEQKGLLLESIKEVHETIKNAEAESFKEYISINEEEVNKQDLVLQDYLDPLNNILDALGVSNVSID